MKYTNKLHSIEDEVINWNGATNRMKNISNQINTLADTAIYDDDVDPGSSFIDHLGNANRTANELIHDKSQDSDKVNYILSELAAAENEDF